MNTENAGTAVAESDDTEVAVEKTVKFELFNGFEGETMSLKEAMELSSKSKVTLLKIIKQKRVLTVGKIVSNSRGRPASLYNRSELTAAIIHS